MELIPIQQSLEGNLALKNNPLLDETLSMTLDFYKRIDFVPPWICYYAKQDGKIVGSAGFKGPPVNNTVEIAYVTFETFRQQGIGTRICKELVNLSLKTNSLVKITARTLPEKNYSTKILEKNNFKFTGAVFDPEDGDLWEWEFDKKNPN